jgi:hypothetical protein
MKRLLRFGDLGGRELILGTLPHTNKWVLSAMAGPLKRKAV